MHLLIVSTHVLPAEGYGGTPVCNTDLARAIAEAGRAVRLLASDGSEGPPVCLAAAEKETRCPVMLYPSRHAKRFGFGWRAIFLIFREVRRANAVYVGAVGTWPTSLALLFTRMLGKPYAVGLHGGYLRGHLADIEAEKPAKRLYYRFFVEPMARGARFIHAMSEMEKADAAPFFKSPIVVAPLSVDVADVPFVPLGATERDGSRFIYAGRLSPEKGILGFVRAWRKAASINDTLEIVGEGAGDYAHAVNAEINADKRIRFRGYRPRGEVQSLMCSSHIVVLPSGMDAAVRENYGIVVAEALAIGRPVLVAQGLVWDGLEDEGAGIVFAPTPEGAAQAVKRFSGISSEALNTMSHTARRYAEAHLDLRSSALTIHDMLIEH